MKKDNNQRLVIKEPSANSPGFFKLASKIFVLVSIVAVSLFFSQSADAAALDGRILLQVQDKGQAWYVNPVDSKRYYLGRPDDAFRIMREFGLGASNRDISVFLSTKAPSRLAGRILLQVQDKGQAYYVEPLSFKLHYLGRPTDAFNVIRSLGLGISNTDLSKITIGPGSAIEPRPAPSGTTVTADTKVFNFKYRNNNQSLYLNLSPELFNYYQQAPKVYTYYVSSPPPNLQEAFYNMFLEAKSDDSSIEDIVSGLQTIANQNGWYGDWVAEMALALVQYIPYDQSKVEAATVNPFYPYETLYLNRGVCSDKTFLAYKLLRRLGYGVSILDFADINHSAIGIACPIEYSLAGSGYCYAETTNYFPIGVIPNNISGQAQTNDHGFDRLFDESKLGKIEVLNKTTGKIYQQAGITRETVAELSRLYKEIVENRDKLGGNYAAITAYNQKVATFNKMLADFYQQ